jgi:hypothetical protein
MKCGGNHRAACCTEQIPKCFLCQFDKDAIRRKLNIHHRGLSVSCHVRKREEAQTKRFTDYGNQEISAVTPNLSDHESFPSMNETSSRGNDVQKKDS